jgi:hypothetical protein
LPVLVGVLYGNLSPIFVAVDGTSRVGRDARFSILFNKQVVVAAQTSGWETYISDTGERMVALSGENFPVFVAALGSAASPADWDDLVAAVKVDLAPDGTVGSTKVEKQRRKVAALRTVRDGAFSRKVFKAYGRTCAMCGIGSPLLQAAHIYPVSAPGSTDHVSNGIALCANHHLLFDAHLLGVDPNRYDIKPSPELLAAASKNKALRAFIDGTFGRLAKSSVGFPNEEMLTRRYKHFEPSYSWLAPSKKAA